MSETATSGADSPCSIDAGGHAARSRLDLARELILGTIGADRVAAWCGVKPNTVYQWLRRGNDQRPIPPGPAMTIAYFAKCDGIEFDLTILAPAPKRMGA